MVKTERSVSNKVILDIFSKAYFVSISSPKVFVYALLFIIKLKGMCYTNFHFHSPLSIANFLSLSKLMFIISRFDETANYFVISLLLTTQNLPSLKRMRPFQSTHLIVMRYECFFHSSFLVSTGCAPSPCISLGGVTPPFYL